MMMMRKAEAVDARLVVTMSSHPRDPLLVSLACLCVSIEWREAFEGEGWKVMRKNI